MLCKAFFEMSKQTRQTVDIVFKICTDLTKIVQSFSFIIPSRTYTIMNY